VVIQTMVTHFTNTIKDTVAVAVNEHLARLGTTVVTMVEPAVAEPVAVTSSPIFVAVELAVTKSEIETEAPVSPSLSPRKRQLSDEARKRISESQKAKWATRDRKLTPEARAKISESQRKRWAVKNGTTYVPATPREAEDAPTEADRQTQPCDPVTVTAAITPTLTIPVGAVLAVKEGYKGDPFYISEDGHFIGHDGFVVPKDFEEFIERQPKYIETWVRRRLNGYGIEEDIEDWCQDLMIHMKYLPPTSKHRKNGKTDVFQTFDPFSQYGASERRWRYYINYCLTNKYNTIHGKRTKNPVCRAGNLSLASETNPEVHGEVTDEYVYSKSEYLMAATNREEKKLEDQFFAHAFIKYVEEHDPDVFPVLVAVYEAGTSAETIKEFCRTCQRLATTVEMEHEEHKGHEIGLTPQEYNRARIRLKQLAGAFTKQRGRKSVKG